MIFKKSLIVFFIIAAVLVLGSYGAFELDRVILKREAAK